MSLTNTVFPCLRVLTVQVEHWLIDKLVDFFKNHRMTLQYVNIGLEDFTDEDKLPPWLNKIRQLGSSSPSHKPWPALRNFILVDPTQDCDAVDVAPYLKHETEENLLSTAIDEPDKIAPFDHVLVPTLRLT